MHCDFSVTPIGDGRHRHICRVCGRVAIIKSERLYAKCRAAGSPASDSVAGDTKPPAVHGPGTELKKLLRRFGIVATANCKCNARAAEMDRRGTAWCRANLAVIVGWLEEEAKSRNLFFSVRIAELLVKRAIAKATKADGDQLADRRI